MTRFDEIPVVKSKKAPRVAHMSLDAAEGIRSIADEAYSLVHGKRAEDYGHPRFDFRAIAKVWTGLLQDVLKEDAELDEYRVALLMSGLKLARLVKSPAHHDSRVDVIGYMLTMERLDEVDNVVTEQPKDSIPEPGAPGVGWDGTTWIPNEAWKTAVGVSVADLVPQPREAMDEEVAFLSEEEELAMTPGELKDLEERYAAGTTVLGATVADLEFSVGDRFIDRFGSYWELHKRGTWYATAARSSNDLALLAPAAGPLTVTSGAYNGLVIETDGSIWWE